MFIGPAGTGKTTIARIFAAMINCSTGMNPNPPLDDPYVQEIFSANNVSDVIETDAATKNKIENIRDMKEKIVLSPAMMRKRIWILDECHRLTRDSWEALLKVIEEPPSHLIFIFCSTEDEKIPETIKTRCMCLEFRRHAAKDIFEHLKKVAGIEKLDIDEDALWTLASSSRGSIRQSLSMLETLIAYGQKIDQALVTEAIGLASSRSVGAFVKAIAEKQINEAMKASSDILGKGVSPQDFLCEVANFIYFLMMHGANVKMEDISPVEAEEVKQAFEKFKEKIPKPMKCFKEMIFEVQQAHDLTVFNMQPQYMANTLFVALYQTFQRNLPQK
jgi:DNA polymerase-3 subunit gamma/tau